MKLQTLLARLAKEKSISITLSESVPSGPRVFTISSVLPEFPHGKRKMVWYTLVIEVGQDVVPEVEVDALLRRLWHMSIEFDEESGIDSLHRSSGSGE